MWNLVIIDIHNVVQNVINVRHIVVNMSKNALSIMNKIINDINDQILFQAIPIA